MIYLDNSSTTKPYPEILQTYEQVSQRFFGNPSSLHLHGVEADQLLNEARQQIKTALSVNGYDIVFTSGASEANNIALKGIALAHSQKGKHIITSSIEHPSVTESLEQLKTAFDFDITYLPVDRDGRVSLDQLEKAIRKDTILVSIMHVNNETGVIQPVEDIGKIVKRTSRAYFHVDHVQGINKVPLDIARADIDLCTISGHKFHGLKGTGALILKEGMSLFPLISGGKQQNNRRAGTENTAGAVALAKAINLSSKDYAEYIEEMKSAKENFIKQLKEIKDVILNTPEEGSAPHIINFSVPGIKAEVLLHMLEERDIFVSTTSACSSKQHKPSKVLLAMGKGEQAAASSIRISMTYRGNKEIVEPFMTALKESVHKLKGIMR
ncbi:cysteine desulfurase family protein [Bacillus sonorensis]|uniref:cysteine desulfurase family protein n=1 Tax=Bacillus sonorensis TaxID=119858 RepID=UPI002282E6DB|nr:cysteine desulfurase family protein [Bacillus sonorensis]MCY8090137.1 cysteine desulfurase [Bacillus sonorensis]MCY8406258.1 cysteine desulfurase [Bacillus sonorensis]MEC1439590.1 cysteine desulfurase family protein [Bacillus sonorensis]